MGQVGVTLGHLAVAVAQQLLHLIEGSAAIDQKRGKGMTEVMHP